MNKDIKYRVFLIYEQKKGNTIMPENIFLQKNINEAEMYFRAYINDIPIKNKMNYNIKQIGYYTRNSFINEEFFVANGYEKKEDIREIKDKIKKASLEKDIQKQIKIIFNGVEIC